MKYALTFIAIGLIVISLIGCASPAQSITEPTATTSPLVSATSTPVVAQLAPIKLEDCTIGTAAAKCGAYRVYENRLANSGRQIDLKIAVLPASTDHVEPDPLFYFAGGPVARPLMLRPCSKLNSAN